LIGVEVYGGFTPGAERTPLSERRPALLLSAPGRHSNFKWASMGRDGPRNSFYTTPTISGYLRSKISRCLEFLGPSFWKIILPRKNFSSVFVVTYYRTHGPALL